MSCYYYLSPFRITEIDGWMWDCLVVRNSAFDMKGTSHVVEFEFKGLNLQAAAGTSMDDMFSATLAAMGKNSQVQ